MPKFDELSFIKLPIEDLVALSFYLLLAAYAIFSAILYYHWKTYGTDKKVTGLTIVLYFVTTLPLLVVMGIMSIII